MLQAACASSDVLIHNHNGVKYGYRRPFSCHQRQVTCIRQQAPKIERRGHTSPWCNMWTLVKFQRAIFVSRTNSTNYAISSADTHISEIRIVFIKVRYYLKNIIPTRIIRPERVAFSAPRCQVCERFIILPAILVYVSIWSKYCATMQWADRLIQVFMIVLPLTEETRWLHPLSTC